MEPAKPCLGSCSQHGACVHTHVSGEILAPLSCPRSATHCDAACVCNEGWYGSDCSQDEFQFQEVTLLRTSMVSALGDASEMQDVEASALDQQSGSLVPLTSDPSQLSGDGTLALLDISDSITGGSASVGLSGGTSDSVGATMSSLLSTELLSGSMNVSDGSTSAPGASPTAVPYYAPTPTPTHSFVPTVGTTTPSPSAASLTASNESNTTRRLEERGAHPARLPTSAPSAAVDYVPGRYEISEGFWRRRNRRLDAADSAEIAIAQVCGTMSKLTSAHLLTAVSGEASTTMATPNMNMASTRAFARDVGAQTLKPPAGEGSAAPQLSLGSALSSIGDEDGISEEADIDTQVLRSARTSTRPPTPRRSRAASSASRSRPVRRQWRRLQIGGYACAADSR